MVNPRKATMADGEAVLAFYDRMIDEMQGTDFDVRWRHNAHPSHAFLLESIEKGELQLGLTDEGAIACALVVNHEGAPGYENVPWACAASPSDVGVLHVVATLPAYHGQGFASQLLRFTIETARQEGLRALRLDTFDFNVRSHGLYEKLGFTNLGTYPVHYDALGDLELVMFERVL